MGAGGGSHMSVFLTRRGAGAYSGKPFQAPALRVDANLVVNPSFEADLTNWEGRDNVSFKRSTYQAIDGIAAIEMKSLAAGAATDIQTSDDVVVQPSTSYRIS